MGLREVSRLRKSKQKYTYGIQGGPGSFNHQAIATGLMGRRGHDSNIKYLYTTEKVLDELDSGKIDFGQFAICNSLGGVVEESARAVARHKFEIVDMYQLRIRHTLMVASGESIDDIDTIMAHPQVLKQCRSSLRRYYPDLVLESGQGELIDSAKVAEQISLGILGYNVGVIGSEKLTEIYDLKVIVSDLQDRDDNITTFLLTSRVIE